MTQIRPFIVTLSDVTLGHLQVDTSLALLFSIAGHSFHGRSQPRRLMAFVIGHLGERKV